MGEYQAKKVGYIEIRKGDRVYMRRWYLIRVPRLFSVRVHHIRLPDEDRWPHDHPWTFLSVILRGGYRESWCTPETFQFGMPRSVPNPHWGQDQWVGFARRHVRRFSFHRATDLHRITEFDRGSKGAWTLILTGPEGREWGFRTDEGWVSRVDLGLGMSAPRHGPEPD